MCLRGVSGGAVESLELQVMRDPVEGQFDLPVRPMRLGNDKWGKKKIVAQEDQSGFLLGAEVDDAAHRIGIVPRLPDPGQPKGWVAPYPGGAIDGARGAKVELQILFGACNKEGTSWREDMKTSEAHVTAIHHVECSDIEEQFIEPESSILAVCKGVWCRPTPFSWRAQLGTMAPAMYLLANRRIKDRKEHRYWSVEESRRLRSGRVV